MTQATDNKRGGLPKWAKISAASVALLAASSLVISTKPILINDSPSLPEGLWYLMPGATVTPGKVIAFSPPETALPYVRRHLKRYLTQPLLKPVAAGAGARVCGSVEEGFSVDGKRLGVSQAHDSKGNAVTPWTGCHTLTANEFAVFSSRIPNSYDSRYYGPVSAENISGVYRPLWLWGDSKP